MSGVLSSRNCIYYVKPRRSGFRRRALGSVLVNSLEEAAEWVKQNVREGDLVITLGCGDIYKASKMMVADNQ